MRSLRASELGPAQLVSARSALRIAFSTYAANALVRGWLLTQWRFVERVTATPLVPPLGHLTTLGLAIAAVLSILLVVFAALHVLVAVRFRRLPEPARLIDGLSRVVLAALVWLVWNHRADAAYAWCALVAFIPLAPGILTLLALPTTVLHVCFVTPIARRLRVAAMIETDVLIRDRHEGRPQVRDGNRDLERLYAAASPNRLIEARLALLVTAMYLPLIAAFWLG
jgi:hypothetical protein